MRKLIQTLTLGTALVMPMLPAYAEDRGDVLVGPLGGDTTPIAVVRRLLTGFIHQTIREEDESRYLTPALNSLLDRYWGHGDPLGHGSAFDADVVFGAQDYSGLEIHDARGMQLSDNVAIVVVELNCNECTPENRQLKQRYSLIRLADGQWKIDDIVYSFDPLSLREMIQHTACCETTLKVPKGESNDCALITWSH
jgi:hypothetical protein